MHLINNNIEHIFFDLDHTLWDFEKNSALSFQYIFQQAGLSIDMAAFLKVYNPINDNYWKLYREDKIPKDALRTGRLVDTFEQLNITYNIALVTTLADAYIQHLPQNNYLLEGVEECLEYLKKNYKLHIITNGFSEVQHVKLKKSGIKDYFLSITTSEEAGVKKPHPLIFEKALHKAAAENKNALMIGDNLEADILGAKQFGMQSVYFNTRGEKHNYNGKQIAKLSELKHIL
ncbi:putative hydrolase of the HAD superfamily [Mesonia hippocampi]|uniref:Putative hydrolase of the HAD superfamily n=1 Tax=Mesonia hippocampi TaxID=1628250 RepID=A0A840EVN3_9FLAO|nr:YjjG family noncanonical pyrimidine nucleotidase [Mesonia hippocampi]MBB4118917.1 putative hydrolase of the HAD superfamily [Mesonia hippocampi]